MTVAGLVLAAGAGRRLGGPKALVRLGGELLVERAVRTLRDGGCESVHVVVGARADEVVTTADLAGVTVVRNDGWDEGIGSSLRAGLAALPAAAEAAVVVLVDQPLVTAAAVRRAVAAWQPGTSAVVATYGDHPGHPVVIERSAWAGVAATAVGDRGARAWLQTHADAVRTVACDDLGSATDIDTPDDLTRILEETS